MSPPTYFPLRWESTGDQWWYASPIDWAAANGHYDLVRELLRLDANHLIKLTSLRRIRRLETVWDDDAQFHDVARCRSEVARRLLSECEMKKGRNSLIGGGYGGWVLYTAASAGDMGFVMELLERDPLLVFGEGEYGVTDILYAAARSKDSEVFKVVLDYAAAPRLGGGGGGEQIPAAYRAEIMNRAIHAAARGGNLRLLKELVPDWEDALAYRDVQGATVLHAAAARGQVEVVRDVCCSWCGVNVIMDARDNEGNTALHVAAQRGHLSVVEALILASPSSITAINNAGDTFLHAVVAGFQTPGFRRLDRQLRLMKHLLSGELFPVERIINAKNNQGRTALHLALIMSQSQSHSHALSDLLMTVSSIDLNIRDLHGFTPLDILRHRLPLSDSDRQLISAGGIFTSQDYSAIASRIKRQSLGSSPGTSFRISDVEIFLCSGLALENGSSGSVAFTSYSPDPDPGPEADPQVVAVAVAVAVGGLGQDQDEMHMTKTKTMTAAAADPPHVMTSAAQRLKRLLHWPKEKVLRKQKKLLEAASLPMPLRQRYSSNKRALSVRSSQPSPIAKKKLASHGMIMQQQQQRGNNHNHNHRSRSSSFSKMSFSSHSSLDVPKGVENDHKAEGVKRHHKSSVVNMNQYLCFGGPSRGVETGAGAGEVQPYEISVLAAA